MRLDLAIVVPVGPGDESWRDLLPQLLRLPASEIVLVFADDISFERPAHGSATEQVRFASAPRGRAHQLNAGAQLTTAAWIWFLHADSLLDDTAEGAIAKHMQRAHHELGYFDLRFQDDGPRLMALNSLGTWLRSRWLNLPFGDQGFLLSRALFEQLEGFDTTVASGEDHELIWRARRAGARIRPMGAPLHTSARKYSSNGWCRTTVRHLAMTWRQARAFSRWPAP